MKENSNESSIKDSATSQQSFDTVNTILEAHQDRIIENITVLIKAWSENGILEEGLSDALLFLYRVANYSRRDFRTFLTTKFEKDLLDEGEIESYNFFDSLSSHCNGDFTANDPLLAQCSFISSFSKDDLASHSGLYFKTKLNSYLRENFSEFIYINDELIKQVDEVANDINEPSRTSGSLSRKQVENLQNKTSSISR